MSLPLEESVSDSGAVARDGDPPILTDSDGQFARNYNRRNFRFRHGLKDHPLFGLPNLVELARRPFHHEAYWSNGKVNTNDPWAINRDARLSLVDAIANIGDNNSLVILKHVEQDPVYGPVLKEFLARVVAFSGEQMRQEVMLGEVLILIASPNRLTSYHMDAECNFLVQVAGSKTLWVYDHTDPTLVSHEEPSSITGVTLIALSTRKAGNPRLLLMSYTPAMACTFPFSRRTGRAITTTFPLP